MAYHAAEGKNLMLGKLTILLTLTAFTCTFAADKKLALKDLPPAVKHRSRMTWHVADHAARERTGCAHALAVLLGPNWAVTETSVANLLAVIDGTVTSPPRDAVLDGISLRVTRELCGGHGVPFAEAPVTLADVHRTSEAMLTGTGFCLAGVREYHHYWNPTPRRFDWPGC